MCRSIDIDKCVPVLLNISSARVKLNLMIQMGASPYASFWCLLHDFVSLPPKVLGFKSLLTQLAQLPVPCGRSDGSAYPLESSKCAPLILFEETGHYGHNDPTYGLKVPALRRYHLRMNLQRECGRDDHLGKGARQIRCPNALLISPTR